MKSYFDKDLILRFFWVFFVPVLILAAYALTLAINEEIHIVKIKAYAGNMEAQLDLGVMYYNGKGVPQDYVKAIEWYEKAADQESADAQMNLGYIYQQGLGVRQDKMKALELYKKAERQQNDARAQILLGNLYGDEEAFLANDPVKSIEWYEKAANQNNKTALQKIARAYEHGINVSKNMNKAKEWYGKLCDSGDQEGCFSYRMLNERGY